MRSPLYIHALWLLILVAIVSMGAMSSRGPHAAIDALARAELVELRGELDRVRSALVDAEEKVKYITIETANIGGVAGPHMIVTGCNVHLRSGSGKTSDGVLATPDEGFNLGKYKGLGNLIIGYDEENGGVGVTDRHGSHNLVIGSSHKFSSCGGLVAGQGNTVSGRWAAVSGGSGNVASGIFASVTGGQQNKATGANAVVSSGLNNKAEGDNSSVTGGNANKATGDYAVVSAGEGNTAEGDFSSVSGGKNNKTVRPNGSLSDGQNQVDN